MRLVARPMLASMFVVGGVNSLRNAPKIAPKAEPVTDAITEVADKIAPEAPIPHDPTTLVRINGAVHILAGLTLATGRAPRLSSAVLAATLLGLCLPACVAQAVVADDLVAALRKGTKMSLVVTSAQGKTIPIDVSLAGFAKSFDGPGVDKAAAENVRQQLAKGLQERAQEARQKLIDQQQKELNAPAN